MNFELTRRQALLAGAGALAVASGPRGLSTPAFATPEDADALIGRFTGGVEPAMARVTLDVPELVENGGTVPMDVRVDSPMTADDHVTEILIVADGNPSPGVATFRFSPISGVAQASTRIRLAATQNVMAVARTSDGSVFMDRKAVTVTVGGCAG